MAERCRFGSKRAHGSIDKKIRHSAGAALDALQPSGDRTSEWKRDAGDHFWRVHERGGRLPAIQDAQGRSPEEVLGELLATSLAELRDSGQGAA